MTLVTELKKAGIITNEDAIVLQQNLNGKKLTSYQKLNLLYQHFEGKIFSRPQTGGFSVSVNVGTNNQLTNLEESKGYFLLLQLLLDHGIISDIVHQKLHLIPLKGDKHGYFTGLHFALSLTQFYNEFCIEKQLAFAELLAGKDKFGRDSMLDSRKKKKLIRDINNGKLNSYLDFFEYCHGCKVIDIDEYIEQPKTKLIKTLVKIFNSLIFEAFTIIDITIKEESFEDTPNYHNTKAFIYIDTVDQIHTYYYTYTDYGVSRKYNITELLKNLLTSVNQLLANYNSINRLTGIVNNIDKELLRLKHNNYAICLINPESSGIFDLYNSHEMNSRFMFSQPLVYFRLPLSYKKIQYAVHHFKSSGMFAHLSEEQLHQVTDHLYASNYEAVGDLLKIFPDTVITVERTVEKGRKPYHDFLLSLDNISRGVLNITDVTDNSPEDANTDDETTFDVYFNCNGKHHKVECSMSYGEFNDCIIYYIIKEIIRKDYKDYQLLQLINGDYQKDVYLFANNKQISYLKKMKLIESIDRFF